MTPKQISKEFTNGLRNLGLSEGQIIAIVTLARGLLNATIPLEPIKQVERRATEIMEGKQSPIRVADFTVQDYGMESASCFLGDSLPSWEELEIGVGDNPIEALDDALESISQGDDDIDLDDLESRIKEAYPAFTRKPEDLPSATQYVLDQWKEDHPYEDLDGCEEAMQDHDFHYYIGIGWNLPKG